jgi:transposase-like protein
LEKNKHANKKLRAGGGTVGKTPVMGMKSRKGRVYAFVIEKADTETLTGNIRRHIKAGSNVYTDEWKAYTGLKEYSHEKVSHKKGEYVLGDVHTNGIESFWAIVKRAYKGTYHDWSDKHMNKYIAEFYTRANWHNASPLVRMNFCVMRGLRKTLSYKELARG